ncbi:MAG TPA: flagellar protein FlaG [Ruminiclostridium sp.]|nr:flagellar protein FlaG [Ruminiclostridium sp.]
MQINSFNFTANSQTIMPERQSDDSKAAFLKRDDLLPAEKNNDESNKSTFKTKEANKTEKTLQQQHPNTKLNFKIHKGTGDVMIQIIDSDTGSIIREYPPEKILDSIADIWKCAGIKVDKEA